VAWFDECVVTVRKIRVELTWHAREVGVSLRAECKWLTRAWVEKTPEAVPKAAEKSLSGGPRRVGPV
jgi:hypothetical protein